MLENFPLPPGEHWQETAIGGGEVQVTASSLRMSMPGAQQGVYTDAQIDDYGQLARRHFPWRPPLCMQVRARSSLPGATANGTESDEVLRGTAGFGFWNYPFSIRGDILMLPEAIWFFYASPPSNMALVPGLPGYGWKAQVVHSMRPGVLLATPPLLLSIARARLTGETRPAARWMQRLSGAREALLSAEMTSWHTYTLQWQTHQVLFQVDGQEVLRVLKPPTRLLGFVAWLDNQFAIATPRGLLRFGTLSSGPQWFDISDLQIEPL